MPIYDSLPEELNEFDVVIAGGGTAGCVVAARLAMADPALRILLIELGPNNYNDPSIIHPLMFAQHLLPGSKTTIFYQGNEAPQLAGRIPIVQAGGVLGGGSSINFMVYVRAQRSDFESWKTPGWSAEELLPYLKKLETYHGPGSAALHGDSGPVHVSDGPFRATAWEDDFLQAAASLGYPEIPDLQDLDSNNGFQRWLKYVSPDGLRQDAAHTFLHPLLQDGKHPNLHVLVGHKIVKVLLDERQTAHGVEFVKYEPSNPIPQITKSVKATKQAVVSSGACGSPAILERSGIGQKEVLAQAKIEPLVDLPGVGHDYQDHHLMSYTYNTTLSEDVTITRFVTGQKSFADALASNINVLGCNGIDVFGKIRPTDQEAAMLGPEFEAAWNRDFKGFPDKPLVVAGPSQCALHHPLATNGGQNVVCFVITAYPYSRGKIHVTGAGANDPLNFDVGFFNDPHDLDIKMQVWGYKKTREIMRRTKAYNGEVAAAHPAFPAGSRAACIEGPAVRTNGEIQDLEYSAEDDAAIEQFLRETVHTTWHSLGTAKMAPREQRGVVDPFLNVYGTQRLKVADLGIVPENVGANTNNTAFLVGEKCADIIVKELGL